MELSKINETHNLYIIRAYGKDFNLIKFGYSSNIKNRLKSYYSHNPLIELVGTYYRDNAYEIEMLIHNSIKSDAFREWYSESNLPIILKWIQSESVLMDLRNINGDIEGIKYNYNKYLKRNVYYGDKIIKNVTVDELIEMYQKKFTIGQRYHLLQMFNDSKDVLSVSGFTTNKQLLENPKNKIKFPVYLYNKYSGEKFEINSLKEARDLTNKIVENIDLIERNSIGDFSKEPMVKYNFKHKKLGTFENITTYELQRLTGLKRVYHSNVIPSMKKRAWEVEECIS